MDCMGTYVFKAYNAVLKYVIAKMISNLCSAVQLEQHVNGRKQGSGIAGAFWRELELLRVPELSTNQIEAA